MKLRQPEIAPQIIIQARMGSARYPGKSLETISGRESLGHLLDAVRQSVPAESITVATSTNPENDQIEAFCRREKVACFRGDDTNVASRFFRIISDSQAECFVRLNADSPLFDHRVLELALMRYQSALVDLVTTAGKDPYPSGMNVEVVRAASFISAYSAFNAIEHFEHVTRYFYEHEADFKIHALRCPIPDARKYKFSFDDQADKTRIEAVFSALTRPHFTYTLQEKCAILCGLP